MLEQPPSVLLPLRAALANFTSWFDWNALEAIGTVGALWFVVVQTTRSGRAERLARLGTLTALIGLIEPIASGGVPEFGQREGDMLNAEEVQYLLGARGIVERAVDGLKRIPSSEVSAVGAAEYVSALGLTLEYILEQLPTKPGDKVRASYLNASSSYTVEACEFFRQQRDIIRHGYAGSQLRAVLRNLGSRAERWWYEREERRRSTQAVIKHDGSSVPPLAPQE